MWCVSVVSLSLQVLLVNETTNAKRNLEVPHTANANLQQKRHGPSILIGTSGTTLISELPC